MKRRSMVPALAVGILAVVVACLAAASAQSAGPREKPTASKVVFFTADGMRPDLMEKYAAAGKLPTYKALLNAGVRGDNGMQQGFPTNTGVGWYNLAT